MTAGLGPRFLIFFAKFLPKVGCDDATLANNDAARPLIGGDHLFHVLIWRQRLVGRATTGTFPDNKLGQ